MSRTSSSLIFHVIRQSTCVVLAGLQEELTVRGLCLFLSSVDKCAKRGMS